MRVLIVGSGGREHAMAWKIAQSPKLTKLYAAPGNAGISQVAECVDITATDIDALVAFAKKESIDLTIVGPEAPLVAGIVDAFEKEKLKIFGPNQSAAQLEGSKSFAKLKMAKYGIPTAHFEAFNNLNEAKHYAIEAEMPIVIKADGLAAGKGVIICENSEKAVDALSKMMEEGAFGDAGSRVVIENEVKGEEVSILALTDGKTIIPLVSSQDHKRAYDNDRGPNTGGMGAYSSCPFLTGDDLTAVAEKVIRPMIEGMAADGNPYRGVIYAGIMLTDDGPIVLEYNCRFGDPEAQVVLPRLKSDLLPILDQIAAGNLETDKLEWHDKECLGVVLASGGYPGAYAKGHHIQGIKAVDEQEDITVFHAGTALAENGDFITSGGRVLCVTALGDNLRAAYDKVYGVVDLIQFEGRFFRNDIGRKALEVLK